MNSALGWGQSTLILAIKNNRNKNFLPQKSPHCSNRLKELDPYEIFDSIQSPQTDDPYGPPIMEDIWWRGYSPMDRIIENKFENIFEALIEFGRANND